MLHSVRDLKAIQINVQRYLIWELYELELGYNFAETTKNIGCVENEGAVDHRWLKKFHSCCKNLDDQARLGGLKSVNFEAVLQAIEASTTQRVSGELSISQSCIVCYFGKNIRISRFVPSIMKILQNFWLILVR